jgi:hypothetical protein
MKHSPAATAASKEFIPIMDEPLLADWTIIIADRIHPKIDPMEPITKGIPHAHKISRCRLLSRLSE